MTTGIAWILLAGAVPAATGLDGSLAAPSPAPSMQAAAGRDAAEGRDEPMNQTPELRFHDPSLSVEERVDDLVARLTLEEKVAQMVNGSPGIERLGIPPYNWWNECLHGVARAGVATVFPQAIGLAAMWDEPFLFRVATAISDEARAKHHDAVREGRHEQYYGLTFWSPNINIFRDPRWGRGQETYGEDPYLAARLGVAFCKGLQGDDPKYLKLVATPKHYAVHSGPEPLRHAFDAVVSERDLRMTYLPAFEACVREAGAYSVMGAYNRTNGKPCCASEPLLQEILREEWGFEGYVVSDCGAIWDIHANHKVVGTPEEGAALAVEAGCDLNCGQAYAHLVKAVEQGLIAEDRIDTAVKRLFTARFRLGMFDPPEMVPYARIPISVNDCTEHRRLALEAARKSIVLLKNEGGLLPLSADLRRIAVIGPNADMIAPLLGNYFGTPSKAVTPLDGIRGALPDGVELLTAPGCDLVEGSREGFDEAARIAAAADVAVLCLGLAPRLEGEEGDAAASAAGGDRTSIGMPGIQEDLLRAVHATGTPVVLVLLNGSAVAVIWADDNVPAILTAWYPGEEGGTAVADVLFVKYNPAGRLPVTFYRSLDQVPPFEDYAMARRTYRYFEGEPLYPFGYGLSYTRFLYANLDVSPTRAAQGGKIRVAAKVKNAGDRDGEEVVQLYVADLEASVPVPIRSLQGFRRVRLAAGEEATVTFTIAPRQLALIDADNRLVVEPGAFEVAVGGGQPNARGCSKALGNLVMGRFEVAGAPVPIR